MKKYTIMMLAIAGTMTGLTLNAEEIQAKTVSIAEELSAEELSFAAKLNDQNRKAFTDKLSADQRRAVLVAGKNGADADEAVQRMVAAKQMKEAVISNAETPAPAAQ